MRRIITPPGRCLLLFTLLSRVVLGLEFPDPRRLLDLEFTTTPEFVTWTDGSVYTGDFQNGIIEGYGSLQFLPRDIYK